MTAAACLGASDRLTSSAEGAPPTPWTEDRTEERTIRLLEDRVHTDPEDFVAQNKLAGRYLERSKETGNARYLELASRAARASLEAVPAALNPGGLHMLAAVLHESHDFSRARDLALELARLEPEKAFPHQLLGDALLELGDYEGAEGAFRTMEEKGGPSVASEARFARFAVLRGKMDLAERHYRQALTVAREVFPPSPRTIAWCEWQLGETAYAVGDYAKAEKLQRAALETVPDYFRAIASLGKARSARGDVAGALAEYERVVRLVPDPAFVAALGDLYEIAGRPEDASRQHALVEEIARLAADQKGLYDRQLALFYANHDMRPAEAYDLAVKEYEIRRDIYGADALAWTALKVGRIREARTAIREALRLGTEDAQLFYHAGMIARAAGDPKAARAHLERALEANPAFDPRQAPIARRALTELGSVR